MEVTDRGVLVALLVPPTVASTERERLVAAGRLLPAAGPLVLPQRRSAGAASEAVLQQLREDR